MAATYDFSAVVAPGASVTKGLIYLPASSTVDFRLVELRISMDGGATQFWPKFQMVQGTSGFTAPTGGTTLTVSKANDASYGRASASVGSSGKFGTFTAEIAAGSGSLITRSNEFILNQAAEIVQSPLGREPWFCPISNALYLQVVTPASFANNIAIYGVIEE